MEGRWREGGGKGGGEVEGRLRGGDREVEWKWSGGGVEVEWRWRLAGVWEGGRRRITKNSGKLVVPCVTNEGDHFQYI